MLFPFPWPSFAAATRLLHPLCAAAALHTCLLSAAWAQPIDERRLQHAATAAGPQAEGAVRELLPILRSLRSRPAAMQLHAVNQFFNSKVRFAADLQVWGVQDHWASPLQTLQKGAGDCEDYAIAKYFSLLALGMPAARLRLVYGQAQLDDGFAQAHLVLAYYPGDGGEVLILDNLVDEILSTRQRSDLTPAFSFNSEGLWQGVGNVGAGDPAKRLLRWREVMARARAEGFP